MTDQTIAIEVTEPRRLQAFFAVAGIAQVLDAFDEAERKYGKLPAGFGMARAIAEKEMAEQRAVMALNACVIAQKAGHSLENMHVRSGMANGKYTVELEPFDLADMGA